MNAKRILFWDSSVSDMKSGRTFGGIAVQLNFWMQVFGDNDWEVHSLTTADSYIHDGVNYHHVRHIQSVELVWEWFNIFRIVKRVRPQLIVFRGAHRLLFPLQQIAHCFGAKIIMQGASDVNFEPGKASVGNSINRRMYETAVRKIDYIVCQNEYQSKTLKNNYNRQSLIITNIWGKIAMKANPGTTAADVVWIGNLRRLKRPEWFYDAAHALPDVQFAIAGGAASVDLYNKMESKAALIPNLDFLGQISIEKSNALICRAKILVCSSEYEGFPNTFLQAWAAGIPVVSTVDPNDLIKTYNLGLTADSSESLTEAIRRLVSDKELYALKQRSIAEFFESNHTAQSRYEQLINYISVK